MAPAYWPRHRAWVMGPAVGRHHPDLYLPGARVFVSAMRQHSEVDGPYPDVTRA